MFSSTKYKVQVQVQREYFNDLKCERNKHQQEPTLLDKYFVNTALFEIFFSTWIVSDDTIGTEPLWRVVVEGLVEDEEHGEEVASQKDVVDDVEKANFNCKKGSKRLAREGENYSLLHGGRGNVGPGGKTRKGRFICSANFSSPLAWLWSFTELLWKKLERWQPSAYFAVIRSLSHFHWLNKGGKRKATGADKDDVTQKGKGNSWRKCGLFS